jgi:NitT/TauT family transport system ATP-binding protein
MTYNAKGRQATPALAELTMDIKEGEFLSVVGPSGCGKTTFLRVIAGLLTPTSGQVRVNGTKVVKPRPDVSVMFQSPTLLPWRKVLDNCLLPIELRGRVTAADRDRARSLLDMAGLSSFENRFPHELSGGMQQRAAICRALISSPSVLLLDEPFGALDAMTREQMNIDLQRIWTANAVTTVLITHSINEAVFLAQRVAVMSARPGRILDEIRVPLPDERTGDMVNEPAFVEVCAKVRSYFL